CICIHHVLVFFFFQAEDGIRDRNVTGVQTCALPICVKFIFKCQTLALLDCKSTDLPFSDTFVAKAFPIETCTPFADVGISTSCVLLSSTVPSHNTVPAASLTCIPEEPSSAFNCIFIALLGAFTES